MNHAPHLFRILLAILVLALLLPSPLAAKDDKQQEAEALLAKARELSDIRCEGCPPFRLTAKVQFYKRDQSTTRMEIGSYVMLWQSKSRWREEVNFPDLHSLRWGSDGEVWYEDSFEYPSLRITQLDILMNFPARLVPVEGGRVKVVQSKDARANYGVCVEKQSRWGSIGLQCFDANSGALVREDEWNATFEYKDYLAVGTKTFPRDSRALLEGNVTVQVHVEEVQAGILLEGAVFAASPKAVSEPKCEGRDRVEAAKLVQMVRPEYPPAAKAAGRQGVVRGLGVVGKDGKLYSLEIVHSLSPELDAAALAAWSRWRYRPTLCRGVPITVAAHLEMKFSLR